MAILFSADSTADCDALSYSERSCRLVDALSAAEALDANSLDKLLRLVFEAEMAVERLIYDSE